MYVPWKVINPVLNSFFGWFKKWCPAEVLCFFFLFPFCKYLWGPYCHALLWSLFTLKLFFWKSSCNWYIKFSFSEKATKFAKSSSWFWHLLSKRQNHEDDFANFCGLLRKAELYSNYYIYLSFSCLFTQDIPFKLSC